MIGIYSGTFDPPTLGHLWVLEQAKGMFSEIHVLVGRHPGKRPLFRMEERLNLLKSCFGQQTTIKFGVLDGQVSDYINENCVECVKLIRGIRGVQDVEYELSIANYNSDKNSLETVFFMPPLSLSGVSSSQVKDLARQHKWEELEQHVDCFVLEALKAKLQGINHVMTIEKSLDEVEKINNFFDKMLKNKFMVLPSIVTKSQVESMLDPFPYSMAVSDAYHLQTIWIDDVEPTGMRFVKRSCSLGPIIVDYNESMPEFGEVLVIEGKHRWLDARKRGEKTIKAWVGDKAVAYWNKKKEING